MLTLYLALVFATGYATLCVLLGPSRMHLCELLGWSFAAGSGVVSMALFILSLSGVTPARLELVAIAGIVGFTLIVIGLTHRRLSPVVSIHWPSGPWPAVLTALAVLVIVAGTINVAIISAVPGVVDIDGFAIWMLKAKLVSLQPLSPLPHALLDPALSYSHQDYPLSWPFLVAGAFAAVGRVDELAGKQLLLPMYLALVLIIHAGLRRVLQSPLAMCFTALLVGMPTLVQHSGMAVAELPLVLMHTATLVALLWWMTTGQRRHLLLTALFAVFTAFTKNEGLPLLLLMILTACLFAFLTRQRRLFQQIVFATAFSLLLILPWLIFRTGLPHTHEDYGWKLMSAQTWMQNLPSRWYVPILLLAHMWQPEFQGPLWVVLVICTALKPAAFRRPEVVVLWIFLIAHLGLYAATFIVSPWEVAELMPGIAPKLLAHAAPLAVLLAGLHVSTPMQRA